MSTNPETPRKLIGVSNSGNLQEALTQIKEQAEKLPTSSADFITVNVDSIQIQGPGEFPHFTLVVSASVHSHLSLGDQEQEIIGCVKAGVERGCTILTDRDGNDFDLKGASLPPPETGLEASVKGHRIPGAVSICMQGAVFRVTSWHFTRHPCK